MAPIDVLHLLSGGPDEGPLGQFGLTEQAITTWRRGRCDYSEVEIPSLRVHECQVSATVERVVHALRARRLPASVGIGRRALLYGVELLWSTNYPDADVSDLLADFAVVPDQLAHALLNAASPDATAPIKPPRPSITVLERERRLVLVPQRPADIGRVEVATRALELPVTAPASDIHEAVMETLSLFGCDDEPFTAPYWTRFSERTFSGFARRARLIGVRMNDFSVTLTCSDMRTGGHYLFSGVRQLRAPVDDPTVLGRSVVHAIEGSRG